MVEATSQSPEIHLVVLTGMSGGGKTVALRALEDLGFYCVDNLPPTLIPDLLNELDGEQACYQRIAVGTDIRNRKEGLEKIPQMLSELATEGVAPHLIFIDSRNETLITRYSETRRRHPLSEEGISLSDAIASERHLLRYLANIAEEVIDTSDMNAHQLKHLIAKRYAAGTQGLSLLFESFGYKRGLPSDTDFLFDARCLPNPHWEPSLRPLTGRDAPVREFFQSHAEIEQYLGDVIHFLDTWLPQFNNDNRSYVTVCVGCTGGQHRSVYLIEKLAAHFRNSEHETILFHRELD